MPVAPKRFCAYCRAAHDGPCPARQKKKWQDYDAQRPSSTERGYDADWRRCRAVYLRANPFCADCLARKRLRPAEEVHHTVKIRDDPSRRLDWSVLVGLCKPCHSARTARGE